MGISCLQYCILLSPLYSYFTAKNYIKTADNVSNLEQKHLVKENYFRQL